MSTTLETKICTVFHSVVAVVVVLTVVAVEPQVWSGTSFSEIYLQSNKHLLMPNHMPKIPKIR